MVLGISVVVPACRTDRSEFHLAHGLNRFTLQREVTAVDVANGVAASATKANQKVGRQCHGARFVDDQLTVLAEVFHVDTFAVFGNKAAVPQFKGAVGEGSDFLRVRHDEEGHAVVFVQVLEQGQHFSAGDRVKGAGGFVSQNETRLGDEGASDGHTLLFTTAQHRWKRLNSMAHAKTGQHGVGQGKRLL